MNKYISYILNIALFTALIVFSLRYYNEAVETFLVADKLLLLISFFLLVLINIICVYRWAFLLRIFGNQTENSKIFHVYNISNLYKYVPPKGINYIVRGANLKKASNDERGKVTSMFGEFYTELYVSIISSLILITLLIKIPFYQALLLYILFGILTYALISSKFLIRILDLFNIRFEKIRRLIENFYFLTRNKLFYISMLFTAVTAVIHGIALYLFALSLNINSISIFNYVIIFYSAQFLANIFISPAGLGIRDISLIGILVFLGISTPNAVILSLSYRFLMFLSELLLYLISFIGFRETNST
ncbi:flippase-like domain-containing protein [Candidatus Woesearchaeota archaeon]|nr:flippase-like domain-containing protein [Candidatus Woesearchaeota archaeon]